MLTTIEQKLSAIKAINEEKDHVEKILADLVGNEQITVLITNNKIELPTNSEEHMRDMLCDVFNSRKKQLIENAELLMK